MRPKKAWDLFSVALRLHWALGPVLMLVGTDAAPVAVAAAAVAWAAGTWLDATGALRAGWNRAAPWAGAALLCAAAADLFFLSRDLLSAASLLVLGIQALLFLLPKTARDGWQLCAISFLEFLAAAASTTELLFAFFCFLFFGLSVGAMWALHAKRWREEGGGPLVLSPRSAGTVLLGCAAGGFLLAAVLFFAIPRLGLGRIAGRLARPAGMPGFSDAISLGDVSAVKTDRRVVARVEFPERAPGVDPASLRLKGTSFSRFDGSRWMRAVGAARPVQRWGFVYLTGSPAPGAVLSTADIILEPLDHPALFVFESPITIEGNLGGIVSDGQGNFAFSQPSHPAVHYRVRFGAVARNEPFLPDDLFLPAGSGYLTDLAAGISNGTAGARERAAAALRFLRSGFRYTLDDPAAGVREFLSRKRAGTCEHFATALALILRALRVPARVAAGYLGGEWNGVGNYLIVRQADAHAWTEAWIDGRWVTLDATPAAGLGAAVGRTGRAGMYLDWARQRWNKYVVNYSLKMQAEAVAGGWHALLRFRERLAQGRGRSPWEAFLRGTRAAAAAAFAALFLWLFRRRGRAPGRGAADAAKTPLPRRYQRLVRALERLGFGKSPGVCLEEMIRAAAAGRPALAEEADRLVDLYNRDRFGAMPLSPAEEREAALRARLFPARLSRDGAS